jgi:pimeloyl-ACP methyl ester carboxylesterase
MSPEDEPDRSTERYRHRSETVAVEAGSGPPVVFSHGTLMDRTMFDPQLEALAPEYRVLAYDSRARTDRYGGPYDLYDLADDAAALMDARGIDSCVLCGMSMGGFMALRFAERYPERVAGLVLIDSIAEAHTESEQEQYGEIAEQVRAAGTPPEPALDVGRNLLFGATTNEERPELVERWADRWRTYPGEAFYPELHSWLDRPDFTDQLEGIDVPVLSVHGEEDVALEPERTESMLAALPDARQVMIPAAGHSSNLEKPAPVNAALQEFLDEVYG